MSESDKSEVEVFMKWQAEAGQFLINYCHVQKISGVLHPQCGRLVTTACVLSGGMVPADN